jgi:hypothetical protein
MHVHEFFVHVKDGVAGAWPAERCLGDVPERRARQLLAARQEETITPHGELTGITSWRQVHSSHEDCWLAGKGFVI